MKRRDRSRLWSDITNYGTLTIGRTEWTTGGACWMVRSRVLGNNWPDRKAPIDVREIHTSNAHGRALVHKYTQDARRCQLSTGTTAARLNGDVSPVAVAHVEFSNPSRSTVRVPLNLSWALGLDALVSEHTEGRCEFRADPWCSSASWWTLGANAYPLAILLGIHGVRLTFPEAQS